MFPLNIECTALLIKGLHPRTVIAEAQQLGLQDAIHYAFPTMPNHIATDLMNGACRIEYVSEGMTSKGESFTWQLVRTCDVEDDLYEQAMLEAAETVGPNSYEYDDLVESIYERLCCA